MWLKATAALRQLLRYDPLARLLLEVDPPVVRDAEVFRRQLLPDLHPIDLVENERVWKRMKVAAQLKGTRLVIQRSWVRIPLDAGLSDKLLTDVYYKWMFSCDAYGNS